MNPFEKIVYNNTQKYKPDTPYDDSFILRHFYDSQIWIMYEIYVFLSGHKYYKFSKADCWNIDIQSPLY